jgi:hypothetical protein
MLKNYPKPEPKNEEIFSLDSPSKYDDNSPNKDYNSNASILN